MFSGSVASSPKLERSIIQDGNVPVNPFSTMANRVNLVKLASDDGRVETREFWGKLIFSVRHG